jgi:hypothetical protein
MFKLGCGVISLLCLLVAAFLLWQSAWFPEKLPELAGWATAWFRLFHNPVAAAILLALCVALAVAAACLTDILVGIFFSLLTALSSLLCLLGVLGARFPGFADGVVKFLK